jgi:hypothetical protein
MKKICPLCGTENEENAKFCKECNEPLYDLKKEEKKAIDKEKIREDSEDEWIPNEGKKNGSKDELSEIIKEEKLPVIDLKAEGLGEIILKKGEVVHCGEIAILKEVKTINLGYKGGSHGISVPIVKGIRFRIGSHRGKIEKEEKIIESTKGVLLLTNKRLFLYPSPGYKPVSIPLNKIISYHCSNDGIEIYKEGREKGYLFSLLNKVSSDSMKTFENCFSQLFNR